MMMASTMASSSSSHLQSTVACLEATSRLLEGNLKDSNGADEIDQLARGWAGLMHDRIGQCSETLSIYELISTLTRQSSQAAAAMTTQASSCCRGIQALPKELKVYRPSPILDDEMMDTTPAAGGNLDPSSSSSAATPYRYLLKPLEYLHTSLEGSSAGIVLEASLSSPTPSSSSYEKGRPPPSTTMTTTTTTTSIRLRQLVLLISERCNNAAAASIKSAKGRNQYDGNSSSSDGGRKDCFHVFDPESPSGPNITNFRSLAEATAFIHDELSKAYHDPSSFLASNSSSSSSSSPTKRHPHHRRRSSSSSIISGTGEGGQSEIIRIWVLLPSSSSSSRRQSSRESDQQHHQQQQEDAKDSHNTILYEKITSALDHLRRKEKAAAILRKRVELEKLLAKLSLPGPAKGGKTTSTRPSSQHLPAAAAAAAASTSAASSLSFDSPRSAVSSSILQENNQQRRDAAESSDHPPHHHEDPVEESTSSTSGMLLRSVEGEDLETFTARLYVSCKVRALAADEGKRGGEGRRHQQQQCENRPPPSSSSSSSSAAVFAEGRRCRKEEEEEDRNAEGEKPSVMERVRHSFDVSQLRRERDEKGQAMWRGGRRISSSPSSLSSRKHSGAYEGEDDDDVVLIGEKEEEEETQHLDEGNSRSDQEGEDERGDQRLLNYKPRVKVPPAPPRPAATVRESSLPPPMMEVPHPEQLLVSEEEEVEEDEKQQHFSSVARSMMEAPQHLLAVDHDEEEEHQKKQQQQHSSSLTGPNEGRRQHPPRPPPPPPPPRSVSLQQQQQQQQQVEPEGELIDQHDQEIEGEEEDAEEEEEDEDKAFRALLGAVGNGKIDDIDWLKQQFRDVLLRKGSSRSPHHQQVLTSKPAAMTKNEERYPERGEEDRGEEAEEEGMYQGGSMHQVMGEGEVEEDDAPPSYESRCLTSQREWMIDNHDLPYHSPVAVLAPAGTVPAPANTPASITTIAAHHPSPSWSNASRYRRLPSGKKEGDGTQGGGLLPSAKGGGGDGNGSSDNREAWEFSDQDWQRALGHSSNGTTATAVDPSSSSPNPTTSRGMLGKGKGGGDVASSTSAFQPPVRPVRHHYQEPEEEGGGGGGWPRALSSRNRGVIVGPAVVEDQVLRNKGMMRGSGFLTSPCSSRGLSPVDDAMLKTMRQRQEHYTSSREATPLGRSFQQEEEEQEEQEVHRFEGEEPLCRYDDEGEEGARRVDQHDYSVNDEGGEGYMENEGGGGVEEEARQYNAATVRDEDEKEEEQQDMGLLARSLESGEFAGEEQQEEDVGRIRERRALGQGLAEATRRLLPIETSLEASDGVMWCARDGDNHRLDQQQQKKSSVAKVPTPSPPVLRPMSASSTSSSSSSSCLSVPNIKPSAANKKDSDRSSIPTATRSITPSFNHSVIIFEESKTRGGGRSSKGQQHQQQHKQQRSSSNVLSRSYNISTSSPSSWSLATKPSTSLAAHVASSYAATGLPPPSSSSSSQPEQNCHSSIVVGKAFIQKLSANHTQQQQEQEPSSSASSPSCCSLAIPLKGVSSSLDCSRGSRSDRRSCSSPSLSSMRQDLEWYVRQTRERITAAEEEAQRLQAEEAMRIKAEALKLVLGMTSLPDPLAPPPSAPALSTRLLPRGGARIRGETAEEGEEGKEVNSFPIAAAPAPSTMRGSARRKGETIEDEEEEVAGVSSPPPAERMVRRESSRTTSRSDDEDDLAEYLQQQQQQQSSFCDAEGADYVGDDQSIAARSSRGRKPENQFSLILPQEQQQQQSALVLPSVSSLMAASSRNSNNNSHCNSNKAIQELSSTPLPSSSSSPVLLVRTGGHRLGTSSKSGGGKGGPLGVSALLQATAAAAMASVNTDGFHQRPPHALTAAKASQKMRNNDPIQVIDHCHQHPQQQQQQQQHQSTQEHQKQRQPVTKAAVELVGPPGASSTNTTTTKSVVEVDMLSSLTEEEKARRLHRFDQLKARKAKEAQERDAARRVRRRSSPTSFTSTLPRPTSSSSSSAATSSLQDHPSSHLPLAENVATVAVPPPSSSSLPSSVVGKNDSPLNDQRHPGAQSLSSTIGGRLESNQPSAEDKGSKSRRRNSLNSTIGSSSGKSSTSNMTHTEDPSKGGGGSMGSITARSTATTASVSASVTVAQPQVMVATGGARGVSNAKLIRNALSHVCLAGVIMEGQRTRALDALDKHQHFHGSSFVILFNSSTALTFRGLYVLISAGAVSTTEGQKQPETTTARKIFGAGPAVIRDDWVEGFYKYNSAVRSFQPVPSCRSFTVMTDGVCLDLSALRRAAKERG